MTQDRPWFDPETGILSLDELVGETPSYRKIMEDGIVTAEEVVEQSARVADCLARLESILPPGTKAAVQETLAELAVLAALSRHYEMKRR